MFNLKSFLGAGTYLGVDIGTTSIKIAELTRIGGGPKLTNYGILDTYGHLTRLNDAIQTSSLKIAAREAGELVKTLVKKGNFRTRDAIVSVPTFSSFTIFFDLPLMSNEETAKVLQYQIPQYIPMPMEEASIDWMKVGEKDNEKGFTDQQIVVVAIPKEMISGYQEIFRLAGLKLKMVEVESFGLVRALASSSQAPTIIADIGSRSTNIIVADKGLLRYSMQTDYAGSSLTQAIANGLGIDIKRAEEIKKQKGILTGAAEYELSTLTLPFLDVILNEVKRVKSDYEKNHSLVIEKIILSGGGANLLGFEDYVREQLGMPVSVANPFLSVGYPPEIQAIIKELGPILSTAIGLGIKEFI